MLVQVLTDSLKTSYILTLTNQGSGRQAASMFCDKPVLRAEFSVSHLGHKAVKMFLMWCTLELMCLFTMIKVCVASVYILSCVWL